MVVPVINYSFEKQTEHKEGIERKNCTVSPLAFSLVNCLPYYTERAVKESKTIATPQICTFLRRCPFNCLHTDLN